MNHLPPVDPTVVFSTMFGALILLVGYLWRTHVKCVDYRLTAVEKALAVMQADIESDAAMVAQGVTMRHEENTRRFDEADRRLRELRELLLDQRRRDDAREG